MSLRWARNREISFGIIIQIGSSSNTKNVTFDATNIRKEMRLPGLLPVKQRDYSPNVSWGSRVRREPYGNDRSIYLHA